MTAAERGDRREEKQVGLQEREVAGEHHLHQQQQDAGQPGHRRQEDHQRGELADDVVDARQRLGEIDLQRVGAPIVRNQSGPDVHGDEEDEEVLLIEEVTERRRGRRQKRAACS